MFNIFRKKETQEGKAAAMDGKLAALKSAIDAKKKQNLLAGLQVAAKEVNQRLIASMKTERGVHIESFLVVLGSLAGFSCQMAAREKLANPTGGPQAQGSWAIATGSDGTQYYFGDLLNKPLVEDQHSVWSLVAGAVQKLGAQIPDVNDIFKHVAGTVGSGGFGVPRIPADHSPGDLPINFLKVAWPKMLPLISQLCDGPGEWPLLFGIAIQEAIGMAKGMINPTLAASIAMEAAVPMSKVDLPEFYQPAGADPVSR
ncbi:MAG: hypothetical protein WCD79_18215 [Chthoniobacteraceae bacterium]